MVFEFVYLAFQMLVRLALLLVRKEAELEAGMSVAAGVESCGQNSMWTVPSRCGGGCWAQGTLPAAPWVPSCLLAGRPDHLPSGHRQPSSPQGRRTWPDPLLLQCRSPGLYQSARRISPWGAGSERSQTALPSKQLSHLTPCLPILMGTLLCRWSFHWETPTACSVVFGLIIWALSLAQQVAEIRG